MKREKRSRNEDFRIPWGILAGLATRPGVASAAPLATVAVSKLQQRPLAQVAAGLSAASVRRPRATVAVAAIAAALLVAAASRLPSEVGYAAYFGPRSPEVLRLASFLDEFESGVHVLVVFGCRETARCDAIAEPWALDFLGRLQAALDEVPNVRRTWSALNTPVVVGPLETRTLATYEDGKLALASDWPSLLATAREQRFFTGTVLAPDGRSAGVVVELQSIESGPMRDAVRAVLATLPRFERELGAEVHVAGDPVWTVVSSDTLERDAVVLTALMFAVMGVLLFLLFRDLWFALLPVLAVGFVTAVVQGIAALAGLPMTSLLSALPPLLVVIAVATSIHYLTAVARSLERDVAQRLVDAAREVGPGCFWTTATTAVGFDSFLWSDLASFRHFGGLAALGVVIAFAVTFTLLPALLLLHLRRARTESRAAAAALPSEIVHAIRDVVVRYPRFVVVACVGGFALLATGAPRLHYAADFGFGEQSFVVRSLRAIEANFRKPMTTEVVVTLPPGAHVYDAASLALLARIESLFAAEVTTGDSWSFLDLLEDAHRADRGRPAANFDELVAEAKRSVALVASTENARWFWKEAVHDGARERARVSVDRAWLDDAAQAPYVARVRAGLANLQSAAAPGTDIDFEGGLVLADRFVTQLRETQWKSFASAFAMVAATLIVLFRRFGALAFWSIVASTLPVAALLGLMGWAGIGVDPANTMVGAILIGIGVDDTIHLALRWSDHRRSGGSVRESIAYALRTAGEPVLVSSGVLALGFSVLLFSSWGGLVGFGLLASLGVGLLLAGNLLLLPAALLAFTRERSLL
jgi:predicted RND superfamily exporter protein